MKDRTRVRAIRAAVAVSAATFAVTLVVDPVSMAHARSRGAENTRQALEPYVETLPKSVVKIDMIPVPGGTVKIGDKAVEVKPFFIAKTETTWEAFDVFIASGPASKAYDQTAFAPDAIARPSKSYILPDLGWGHNGYPAINLSSTTVEMFCRWLSAETKKKYRLPTEAEWEVACRGGEGTAWSVSADDLPKTAWYLGNSKRMTHPVGKTVPNKLGLYDMIGNTGEWAVSADGTALVCGGTFLDPADKQSPLTRRRFDPSWQETDPQIPKSRWWLSDAPFAGFRIVCEP
ncbi:MAG: SUMF1/EgtB/PvdO family nonheme iron enzyme [Armatimonadetes bacterium]|nr:SUMF1/EgtB/PvdO family nonheme iron enzyme [Armatimonadota bacterium]